MENKIYVIYRDLNDDGCAISGFIFGTEEDVAACCDELNKDAEEKWDYYYAEELKCLNPDKWDEFQSIITSLSQVIQGHDHCPSPECQSDRL